MWKIILKYPGTFQYTSFAVPTRKLQRTSEILSFQIALVAARAKTVASDCVRGALSPIRNQQETAFILGAISPHDIAVILMVQMGCREINSVIYHVNIGHDVVLMTRCQCWAPAAILSW